MPPLCRLLAGTVSLSASLLLEHHSDTARHTKAKKQKSGVVRSPIYADSTRPVPRRPGRARRIGSDFVSSSALDMIARERILALSAVNAGRATRAGRRPAWAAGFPSRAAPHVLRH